MENELKELLEKNLEASQESLHILKKMQRARKWENFFKLLKWILIIGVSLGLYYYIQPYLIKTLNTLIQISDTFNKAQGGAKALDNALPASGDLLKKVQDVLKGL